MLYGSLALLIPESPKVIFFFQKPCMKEISKACDCINYKIEAFNVKKMKFFALSLSKL